MDMICTQDFNLMLTYLETALPVALNFIIKVIIAIIVLLVGRKLIVFARKIFRKFLDKTNLDTGVKQFFDKLLNVALYFLLIVIVLEKFGITASTVVAIIGSVGLSIGLALQGTLANFAGGVLILILKPFQVGDYIKENAGGKEGVVTEIQLFYTKLLTLDNQTVILPNSSLSSSSLTNLTQQNKRRVDITVGISYKADIRQAKEVIMETLAKEEFRLQDEPYNVVVTELAESSVNLCATFWVNTADYWPVRWRKIEEIKYALDANHVEIPFPQLTVSYAKNQEGKA